MAKQGDDTPWDRRDVSLVEHRDSVELATPSDRDLENGPQGYCCSAASQGSVSRKQMTLNLIAGGLGTGMFSLPSSMAGSSVILGVLMTFAIVFLNGYTIMILVKAAEIHQVFDLGGLLGLLPGQLLPGEFGRRLPSFGNCMKAFVNAMVWIVLFTSLISYLIVMHDSASPFLQHTVLSHGRLPLVSIAACIVLLLCFLEQRYLSWTSSIALLVNIYLIVVLCVLFFQKLARHEIPPEVCFFGAGKGTVSMLAVLAQCVIIQMCVLPMYEELQDRTPRRFGHCLWTAFTVLAFIFCIFSSVGYVGFGPGVEGNILVSFPRGPLGDAAQIGTILVVSAIFPLMVIPMVAPVRNMALPERLDGKRGLVVACTIVVIVLIAWLGAVFIKSLFIMNVIGGALCVGVFTALAPGLTGLFLLGDVSKWFKFGMILLLLFGGLNMVLGVVLPDSYIDSIKANCLLSS